MIDRLASAAIGFGRFLYDFLVGDDWRVALVMALALVVTGRLAAGRVNAWWLVPALAVTMTGVSLRRRRATARR